MRERPFSIQEIFFGGAGREPSAKMEKTLESKKKEKAQLPSLDQELFSIMRRLIF